VHCNRLDGGIAGNFYPSSSQQQSTLPLPVHIYAGLWRRRQHI
jgi:hypothetical protein